MSLAHHAYVYYSTDLNALPLKWQTPSVDVAHYLRKRWLIADSRAVIAEARLRPVLAKRRVFVMRFTQAPASAQNALLKLLEDSPTSAEFHLLVPHPNILLPTLRSRLNEVSTHSPESITTDDWCEFVTLSVAERLTTIARQHKAADTSWFEAVGTAAVSDSRLPRSSRQLLNQFFYLPGASRKMLLEEIALSLA